MSISDKNTRTLITIPKDFKLKLEKIANKNNRSLNNQIMTILKEYVDRI